MLTKGKTLSEETGKPLAALLLGNDVGMMAEQLKGFAHRVVLIEDPKLENFNSEAYQRVLGNVVEQEKPFLTLMGHTAFGMDLAPSLAAQMNIPLATDCIDITVEADQVKAIRQTYGGKLNVEVRLKQALRSLVTVRPASVSIEDYSLVGEITKVPSPLTEEIASKRFLEYVEAAVGDVDITQANILVSVGRGIKDPDNGHPLMQPSGGRQEVASQGSSGRNLGQNGETQSLYRHRYQRCLSTRCRHEGGRDHHSHKQGFQGTDLQRRTLRNRGGPLQDCSVPQGKNQGGLGIT
jgi:hypothetical protein